jgi:hypothetical protein
LGQNMVKTRRVLNPLITSLLDQVRIGRKSVEYDFKVRVFDWPEMQDRYADSNSSHRVRHFWGTENRYTWGARWHRPREV